MVVLAWKPDHHEKLLEILNVISWFDKINHDFNPRDWFPQPNGIVTEEHKVRIKIRKLFEDFAKDYGNSDGILQRDHLFLPTASLKNELDATIINRFVDRLRILDELSKNVQLYIDSLGGTVTHGAEFHYELCSKEQTTFKLPKAMRVDTEKCDSHYRAIHSSFMTIKGDVGTSDHLAISIKNDTSIKDFEKVQYYSYFVFHEYNVNAYTRLKADGLPGSKKKDYRKHRNLPITEVDIKYVYT